MSTNFFSKGVQLIQDAITKDNANEYKEALDLYCQGIQYLMTALKYEKNEKVITAIKTKVTKFLKRADEIKLALTNNETPNKSSISNSAPKNKTFPALMAKKIDKRTVYLIHGYCRENEKSLYCNNIPTEIIDIFITYCHTLPYEIIRNGNIEWNDIVGLKHAKMLLKEMVILPLKFPKLFTGKRKPYPPTMLYGPRGCGKSYLVNAIAAESKSTIFVIYCKDLVSDKYDFYERDTFIKDIYNMARNNAPSIVCVDGFEYLETDNGRRLKTEILIQMQRVNRKPTIIITEEPWNINRAVVVKRIQKRIYIKMPDQDGRKDIFRIHMERSGILHNLCQDDYNELSEKTDGFNCYEIYCMIQNVLKEKHAILEMAHVLRIVQNAKRSVNTECLKRYQEWTQQYGQKG